MARPFLLCSFDYTRGLAARLRRLERHALGNLFACHACAPRNLAGELSHPYVGQEALRHRRRSAQHGFKWYEIDFNWWGIRALQLLGLARGIKRTRFDRSTAAWRLVRGKSKRK